MPKRISDVSLHVYVTPSALRTLVDTVRDIVDAHVGDREVFAWRFTLPMDTSHPLHDMLESTWRTAHPGGEPHEHSSYEIALSLVGEPDELTDTDMAELAERLTAGLSDTGEIPFHIDAYQRTDMGRNLIPERL